MISVVIPLYNRGAIVGSLHRKRSLTIVRRLPYDEIHPPLQGLGASAPKAQEREEVSV